MFKRQRHTGLVTWRVVGVRQAADGLVASVEVAFEAPGGELLAKVGTIDVAITGPGAGKAVKCGPVQMDLCKIDVPGLDEAIRRAQGGG